MSSDLEPSTPPNPPQPAESTSLKRFRLRGGGALSLEPEGFRLVPARGLKRSPLHAYESVSHVFASERVLLIGTTRELVTIRTPDFASSQDDPESTAAERAEAARLALLETIGAREHGLEQLEDLQEVDKLGEREGPAWIVLATVVLCLLGTAFQVHDPAVQDVGAFLPELFGRGEYWRAITANFLHELTPMPAILRSLLPSMPVVPIHLAVNVGGMFVLGHLVERPLGSWRTVLVLAVSGIGTIVGIMFAGHVNVVGSSGLVAGLAGSMLALEMHQSRWMPSFWRLPRRVFIAVILLQFLVLDQLFSSLLAGGAHLGGFAGGYVATYLLGRPSTQALVPTSSTKLAVYCTATLVLVGFIGALPLARRDMPALERHASRLLNTQGAFYLYEYDNAASWLIATEGGASPQGLELAIALADRAVANTGRSSPGVLDTLAEALYQSGDRLGAILTIEESIRLQPYEPYYREQRRRFTGERDPDDRPPPPGSSPPTDSTVEEEPSQLPFDLNAPQMTI